MHNMAYEKKIWRANVCTMTETYKHIRDPTAELNASTLSYFDASRQGKYMLKVNDHS